MGVFLISCQEGSWGTSSRSLLCVPIKSKDGRTHLSNEEQVDKCAEYFRKLPNQPAPLMLFKLEQEPPAPMITLNKKFWIEVARPSKSFKNNKVSTKYLSVISFTHVLIQIWHFEDVPANWRCGETSETATTGGASQCCLSLARYSVVYYSNA